MNRLATVAIALVATLNVEAQTPGARNSHVLVSAGAGNGVLLFGGASSSTPRIVDTLWRWNGAVWHPLATDGPHSRSLPAAALDTRRGVVVLYGGNGSGSATRYGDTWEW